MQSDDATELGKHASHQDRETHSPEDSATKVRALGTAADPLERYRALLSDSRSSSSRPPELPLLQELYGDVHAALVDVCCTFLDRLARLLQDEAATSAALGTGEALLQHNIALLTSVREARAVLLDPAQGSLWFPLRKAYAYRSRLAEAEKCYQIAVQAERIARHLATQDVVHDLTSFGRTLASLHESLEELRRFPSLKAATEELFSLEERSWSQFQQAWRKQLARWLAEMQHLPSTNLEETAVKSYNWPGIEVFFLRCQRQADFVEIVARLTAESIEQRLRTNAAVARVEEALTTLATESAQPGRQLRLVWGPGALLADSMTATWILGGKEQLEALQTLATHVPSALEQYQEQLQTYSRLWQELLDTSAPAAARAPAQSPTTDTDFKRGTSASVSSSPLDERQQAAASDASSAQQPDASISTRHAALVTMLFRMSLSRLWNEFTRLASLDTFRSQQILEASTAPDGFALTPVAALASLTQTLYRSGTETLRCLWHTLVVTPTDTSTVSTVRNALLEKELIRVYDLCLMPRLVVAMSAGHGLLAPQVLMEAPLHPEGTEDIPEVAALQSLASTGDAFAMHSPRTLEALCVEMRALCEQSAQQTCSERTQNMRKANRILKKMTGFSVSLRLAFGRRLEQQWKEWLPQDCGLSLLGSLLPAMQDEVVRFQTWFTEALCSMLHLVRVQRAEPSTTVPSLSPGLTSNGSIAEERLSANDASDYSRAFQTVFEALHELLSWTLDVVAFVAHQKDATRQVQETQRHAELVQLLEDQPLALQRVSESAVSASASPLAVLWALARDPALRDTYFADWNDTEHPVSRSVEQLARSVVPALVQARTLIRALGEALFAETLLRLEATLRLPGVHPEPDYDTSLDLPALSEHPSEAMIAFGERLLALPSLLEPVLSNVRSVVHLRCLTLPLSLPDDTAMQSNWEAHMQRIVGQVYRDSRDMERSPRGSGTSIELATAARSWLLCMLTPLTERAFRALRGAETEPSLSQRSRQVSVDRTYLEQVLGRLGYFGNTR